MLPDQPAHQGLQRSACACVTGPRRPLYGGRRGGGSWNGASAGAGGRCWNLPESWKKQRGAEVDLLEARSPGAEEAVSKPPDNLGPCGRPCRTLPCRALECGLPDTHDGENAASRRLGSAQGTPAAASGVFVDCTRKLDDGAGGYAAAGDMASVPLKTTCWALSWNSAYTERSASSFIAQEILDLAAVDDSYGTQGGIVLAPAQRADGGQPQEVEYKDLQRPGEQVHLQPPR